jgi:hypothetical protein
MMQAGSTPERLMLHATAPPDFLESAHEWRRLFSETWGTFLLVVVAAGADVVGTRSGGAVTLSMAVVAPGLMVMAIIYFMGAVGGAHLNPTVTLAFAVRRNFPWRRVPGYIIAQVIGGVAVACFLWAMFGTVGLLGATIPGSEISDVKALVMEVLLTSGLVSTDSSAIKTCPNMEPSTYYFIPSLLRSPCSFDPAVARCQNDSATPGIQSARCHAAPDGVIHIFNCKLDYRGSYLTKLAAAAGLKVILGQDGGCQIVEASPKRGTQG